ncbi:MAG: hypothetical protein WC341_05130, partial [Bacteroidales bacterium]
MKKSIRSQIHHVQRFKFIVILLFPALLSLFSQSSTAAENGNKKASGVLPLNERPKIITDYIDPTKYPEFKRRNFPTPTWKSFNDKVQFVAGRLNTGFLWENPDTKFGPKGDRPLPPRWLTGYGSVFRPGIRWFNEMTGDPATDQPFKTAMQRMKDQGIFLFNVGGYGPGSPFNSSFGMIRVPQPYIDAIQSSLGDKFIGFDVGEQDGRYLMSMTRMIQNNSTDRFQSYLNFHHYMERVSNDQGNKMVLLTVQWGSHYQAKNNNIYMIGAESQPKKYVTNNSVNYMMLRGAARTYGLPLFGDVSVFSNCGLNGDSYSKAYGVTGDSNGPTRGNSLNLMRRMIFSQYLYNSAILGFEAGLFEHPVPNSQNETPITEIQKQMYLFVQENPKAGVMHAPVAVLQDFWSGWIPKGGFSPIDGGVSTFGTNTWDSGDWQTHYVIEKLYTAYDLNGYDSREIGGISDTPFGEMTDGLLTDAPKEILARYGLIIFSGLVRDVDDELKEKVNYFLNKGGNLVVTARIAQKIFPQWLNNDDTWTKLTSPVIQFTSGVGWPENLEKASNFTDAGTFLLKDKLTLPVGHEVLASTMINGANKPVIVRIRVGLGSVLLSLSEFGLTPTTLNNGLLPSYSQLISMEMSKQQLFSVGNNQLSFITNRFDSTTYTLGIFNNSLNEKSFNIESKTGAIKNITEIDLTMGRTHVSSSIGYWPELHQNNNGGSNTATSIMGGDVRFFKIQLESPGEVNTIETEELEYASFPSNRYLYLPSLNNASQQLLKWKTMLNHFEGIMIDWGELMVADKISIKDKTSWLNLQNQKVVVDFSRGFEAYFRLLMQDENSKSEILQQLANVFDKMQTVFPGNAGHAIFKLPSDIELSTVVNTLDIIAKEAAKYKVSLLVYPDDEQSETACLNAVNAVAQNNANISYLLNTANFTNIENGINVAGNHLGAVMITPDNIEKSYTPVQQLNSNIIQIFNINFSAWNNVYKVLTNVTQQTEPVRLGNDGLIKPDIKDVAGAITDNYKVHPSNTNYYLACRNIADIKTEVLAVADTLFAYYGGIMLEAKYLTSRDSLSLVNDRRWLRAKGLKVVVDLSQELNNFPDITWFEYPYQTGKTSNTDRMLESQAYLRKVVDKMLILGSDQLIIGAHNGPENDNGYSTDQLPGMEKFLTYAKSKSVQVHCQNNEYNRNAGGTTYNNATNVENYVAAFRQDKGFSNLSFASNSINTFALNTSKIYYPTKVP